MRHAEIPHARMTPAWWVAVYHVMLSYANNFARNFDVAHDAASHALTRAMQDPDVLAEVDDPVAFLCRAARNRVIDQFRERARAGPLPADAPETRDDRRDERLAAVWEGLSGLTDEERTVLDLYHFSGLTDVEVGRAIFAAGDGETPSAAGQRARRRRLAAERRLRDRLVRAGEGPATTVLAETR